MSRLRSSIQNTGVLALVGIFTVVTLASLQADPPKIPGSSQNIPRPGTVLSDDSSDVLMRGKLIRSKEILEGILLNDFRTINRAAHELKRISEIAAWHAEDDDTYKHYSQEFRRQCQELATQSKNLNHDGVKYVYLSLTSTCINCHKHVRDNQRVAGLQDGTTRFVPR